MMALRTEHKIFYSGKDFHHRKLFLLTAALGFSTVKTMTNWERHPRMTVDREKGCWLLPVNIHNGYPAAENLNGRRWTRVCEVLWEQKNGKKPKGYTLHHECRVKLCINPDHLQLLESKVHGKLHARTNPRCVLNPELVLEIKRRRQEGESYGALGLEYGVRPDHIQDIVQGRYWKDVTL